METKTIVIARYSENVDWVTRLSCSYVIFNKGQHIQFPYTQLENDGRETDTFLRYIKDNYYNLPDIVGLVQGNPFDHCSEVIEKINGFSDADSIEILADQKVTIDTDYYYNAYPFLKEFFDKEFLSLIEKNNYKWTFGAGASYILGSKFIKSKPHDWWTGLYNLHEYFLKKDSHHNYEVGHGFERLWPLIWEKALN